MTPRLAWFSPLPPVRSGISAYSAELIPRLTGSYHIDAFVDRDAAPGAPPGAVEVGPDPALGCPIRSAHDFVWLERRCHYDLVVYQLGNAPCHDYMWPYLVRHPGLVVLHDPQLQHARARLLLSTNRRAAYREEFAFNHPEVNPDAANYVVAGFSGSLPYCWPMRRLVVETARTVALHNGWLAQQVAEESPGRTVTTIRMGVGDPLDRREQPEPALAGVAGDDLVFAAFGLVTPEKRALPAVRAFAATLATVPRARLVFVGDEVPHLDIRREIDALGIADRVTITGYVDEAILAAWLRRADVCLCLRWPTSGETSAAWVRCLAAGKPTVVTDLAHTADVATLDPRSWTLQQADPDAPLDASGAAERHAVAVAIDIVDELHSLRLAMRRLAVDPAFRRQLGVNARRAWQADHTLDAMAADYQRAIELALTCPVEPTTRPLPAHAVEDGGALARQITAEIGVEVDFLARPLAP